jgi:menaquinone-dependent protoporphyrinogen IX oxidase
MTVLIAYYSLTGTTRAVATALARELGGDLEEIRCRRYEPGTWWQAAYDSWRGHLPEIEPLAHDPTRYDTVILGGPVWAFHAATPVRAFLRQQATRLGKVAFFLTHGGSASERSLREMALLAGRKPIATLVVREAEVKNARFAPAVSAFAAKLRALDAGRSIAA